MKIICHSKVAYTSPNNWKASIKIILFAFKKYFSFFKQNSWKI